MNLNGLVRNLHKLAWLRWLAKRLGGAVAIRQSFHGGVIFMNAVEHSWAWTSSMRYETFDNELQETLLKLSQNCGVLVDIGCNIGAMSLSVLLRNPGIRAVCVDPNRQAVNLLRRSLKKNGLEDRCNVIEASVGPEAGTVYFDVSGSVLGHISSTGEKVTCLAAWEVVDEYAAAGACLVKLDVEGYETVVLPSLTKCRHLKNVTLVVELHPRGLNGQGDPVANFEALREQGADLRDLDGKAAALPVEHDFTQIVARWPHV